jgi:diguanylate cyclase (GGDEF)-like protein
LPYSNDTKSSRRRSLKANYIAFASIVAIVLAAGSISTSLYLAEVTSNNAQALQLRDNVTKSVNKIRQANQQADIILSAMLVSPQREHPQRITQALQDASDELTILRRLSLTDTTVSKDVIDKLYNNILELRRRTNDFIQLSKDPNWVYPMLPYINNILLESNTEFESATTLALQEIADEEGESYSSSLYREIAQIRDLWRLQILNFRAVIVRFAGLNRIERIPQEKNIDIVNEEIRQRIAKLIEQKQDSDLGFETEEALDVMQYRAKKWYQDYQKVQKIRDSRIWRADIHYIETSIRPIQEQIRAQLEQLEKAVLAWSSKTTTAVERAALQTNLELWGVTVAAVLFVILIYLMISRSVLKPIAKIADAITEEGKHVENLALPSKSSREIFSLIAAYNTMRRQIHHRQMALEHQALHDALTGLPNRALLQDRLEQAIQQARRHMTTVAFILLDLDRFKDINDTLGHSVGDRLLQEVSLRLDNCLRTSDTVARLGGDEFAIICPDVDTTQASFFIEKVIAKIDSPIIIDEQNLYVGASIGVALFPEHGEDADTLMRKADIAMYDAKRHKKGYSFFRKSLEELSTDNLSLLGDLKEELKQPSNSLSLHYQPQIDIHANRIHSAEALLRWNHPENGLVPPDEVVRICEQSGLITELTNWVLEQAIKDCKGWIDSGQLFNVSVNLSAWNLQDPKLPDYIQQLLDRYQLEAKQLTLEITESAVMNDPVRARDILIRLSKMGIQLDIDDYGTGFSSLAYLKVLPVNGLKIDKSFVIDMEEDENDRIIVQSTIDLAHNLNLIVIAEGVETAEALQTLKQHQCDYAQGYYIARPMPENEFKKWCLRFRGLS